MESACYPMIATHDETMLERAARCARETERGAGDWECQMLFGVRADLQERAVRAGRQMRVYVPFGADWYGYLMRRLAERAANALFFARALTHR